jgi:hypothetical protein
MRNEKSETKAAAIFKLPEIPARSVGNPSSAVNHAAVAGVKDAALYVKRAQVKSPPKSVATEISHGKISLVNAGFLVDIRKFQWGRCPWPGEPVSALDEYLAATGLGAGVARYHCVLADGSEILIGAVDATSGEVLFNSLGKS